MANSFKKMIMMANQGSLLPNDYIECEYLESTLNSSGYGQNYINTKLGVFDKEVEMTLQGNSNQKNDYTFPFGDFQDYSGAGLICYKDGYAVSSTKKFNIELDVKVTVNYKWYRKEVNGVLKDFGSGKIGEKEFEYQRSNSIQSTPQQSNFSVLKIFKSWDIGNYGFVGKIFKCKIYDISDGKRVLLMHLIPALRKSDNVAGFYDMVGKKFLTDANLKPFGYKPKKF